MKTDPIGPFENIALPTQPHFIVSVVSHKQALLVGRLLADLEHYCKGLSLSVILTLNVEEPIPFSEDDFSFSLKLIRNRVPKGFGANHNAAFRQIRGDYFCVVNPDICLTENPFEALVASLLEPTVGVAAPLIIDRGGRIEDSARKVPTPLSISKKLFLSNPAPDYEIVDVEFRPEWVAGMFMCFKPDLFTRLGGFDERYFLYYEDVDICCRARLAGFDIVVTPAVRVIHEARRESHRNLRYLKWHLASLARFFLSPVFFASLKARHAAVVQR